MNIRTAWRKASPAGVKVVAALIVASLAGVFLVGLCDEAVRIYRARTNRDGASVEGYGLWERQLRSNLPPTAISGLPNVELPPWEFLEFFRYEVMCRRALSSRVREWEVAKKRAMKAKMYTTPDSPMLYNPAELAKDRYVCDRMRMFYRPGMGWGLF